MSYRSKNKLYAVRLSSCVLVLALNACGDDSKESNESYEDGGTHDAGHDASTNMDSSVPVHDASSDSTTPTNRDSSTADSSTVVDSSTADAGSIPVLNGCAASDYQDISAMSTPTVEFGGLTTAFAYSPKCATINVGQSVVFSGSFTAHPLRPGTPGSATAGSPGNPITDTDSGSTKSVTFSTAGTYPYYCDVRKGIGMVGVIHVK